jgi:hypothetical protein
MKGILLFGLLAFSSYFGHGQYVSSNTTNSYVYTNNDLSQTSEYLLNMENKFWTDLLSLIQLLTNSDDADSIKQQVNQVYHDESQPYQFSDQRFVHRLHRKHLPTQNAIQQTNVNGIKVFAGDTRVTSNQLKLAEQIIQTISLPILQQNVGDVPAQNTRVVLFSNPQTYANSLEEAGVSPDQLKNIASETGGLTVGSDVWIPLYNLQDQSDLANVLTHELTHVVLNQKGIGDSLPTWINEGIAWHDGLLAQAQVSPPEAQQLTSKLNQQIHQVAQQQQLLQLSASENDILNANYNVEWEDYLAIQNLLDTYGNQAFLTFLNGIPQTGVDESFQQTYNMSRTSYETSFYQSLAQE